MTDEEKREKKRAYYREYYRKNRARVMASRKKYVFNNKEKVRAAYKAIAATPKVKRRTRMYDIQKKYRLSPDEYDALVVASCGRCEACGRPDDGSKQGGVHVDHDHSTGRVRGLLCGSCNTALGLLGESQDRVAALASYIRREVIVEDWSI